MLICLVCLSAVFVNSLVKQIALVLGVVVILLLNVVEVLHVGRDALMDIIYMVFQIMCVGVVRVIPVCIKMFLPQVIFVFVYVEVVTPFKSLTAGSQVLSPIMLFPCVTFLLCGRIRVCNFYTSFSLVLCVCLSSELYL